jgi:hypothetical protein
MELTAQMPGAPTVPLDERNGQGSSSSSHLSQSAEDAGGSGEGAGSEWFGFEPVIWECSGNTPDSINQEGDAESVDYGACLRGFIPLPLVPRNMSLPNWAPLIGNPVEAVMARTARTTLAHGPLLALNDSSPANPGRLEQLPSPLAIFSRWSPDHRESSEPSAPDLERWFHRRSDGEHPWISQREIASEHFEQCRAQPPITSL